MGDMPVPFFSLTHISWACGDRVRHAVTAECGQQRAAVGVSVVDEEEVKGALGGHGPELQMDRLVGAARWKHTQEINHSNQKLLLSQWWWYLNNNINNNNKYIFLMRWMNESLNELHKAQTVKAHYISKQNKYKVCLTHTHTHHSQSHRHSLTHTHTHTPMLMHATYIVSLMFGYLNLRLGIIFNNIGRREKKCF